MRTVTKYASGVVIAAGMMVSAMTVANAATASFDFQAIADGAGFNRTAGGPVASGQEAGWNFLVGAGVGIVSNGISVVGTGTANNGAGGTTALQAYFDAGSAGLGACGKVSAANGQCSPGNDDNVGSAGGTANSAGPSFEILTLTFNTAVMFDDLTLAGEGHGIFNGALKINGTLFDDSVVGTFVDNGADSSSLSVASLAVLAGLGASSVWNFEYIPTGTISSTDEFYIDSVTVSAIPLPASLLLLLGGLGGLRLVGRRRPV